MRRHSIIARLGPTDRTRLVLKDPRSVVTELHFVDGYRRLGFGIGQMLDQLAARDIYPSDRAVDLAILAATVTAADTRISRASESQDSWTREIDLYLPAQESDVFAAHAKSFEHILAFLTGDRWRVFFRPRHADNAQLLVRPELNVTPFTSVCLFSGGLDSFIGAIDLLARDENPLLVSHYWDQSTSSQEPCAQRIGAVYGDMAPRHVRARVGFPDTLVQGSTPEKTTRGRSFLFLALAVLPASALNNPTIYVSENGLISLNIPLDPLRLGAWSTRTTHPFYLARWQELLDHLGIAATITNPYRFQTKGEMLARCANQPLVKRHAAETISCSSVTKARWKGLPPGHCGHCVPCLIRRAAILSGIGKDATTYSLANLAGARLDARSAESEHIRSFQLMTHRLAKQPGIEHVLVHKPGPLSDYPAADIAQYAQVFRRGVEEVAASIAKVVVRP
jgi:7-cyano-7-deazaguanine synthase in queuosine biosynthesis